MVRQWIVTPSFAGSNPVVRPLYIENKIFMLSLFIFINILKWLSQKKPFSSNISIFFVFDTTEKNENSCFSFRKWKEKHFLLLQFDLWLPGRLIFQHPLSRIKKQKKYIKKSYSILQKNWKKTRKFTRVKICIKFLFYIFYST